MASNSFLGKIVGLAIGAYLLAYVFIGAVVAYAGYLTTNGSGLGTAGLALAAVITIVLLIGAVILVLREAGVKV